jgi:hypothetical protein
MVVAEPFEAGKRIRQDVVITRLSAASIHERDRLYG